MVCSAISVHGNCNVWITLRVSTWHQITQISAGTFTQTEGRKDGHFLFNDALNTFYLQFHKDDVDEEQEQEQKQEEEEEQQQHQ